MKRLFLLSVVLIIGLTLLLSPRSQATTVIKDGTRCTKLNQKVTYSKKIYQCKKSGSKLVWRFIANVPTPDTKCTLQTSFSSDSRYLWSQEFNEPRGHCPASDAWTSLLGDGYQLGLYKYGTDEIELNTATAAVTDGHGNLVINAIKRNNVWTSSRIWTQGKFNFLYGKIEIRMKLPTGPYNWPAFWMLGSNYAPPDASQADPTWTFGDTPWPNSGEIDIMEGLNCNSEARATLHQNAVGSTDQLNGWEGVSVLAPLSNISSKFHTFGMRWKPNTIIFTLDGVEYGRDTLNGNQITKIAKGKIVAKYNTGGIWPFNKPFFLILNNAVSPYAWGCTTGTSSTTLIDWIRYSKFEGYGTLNP